MQESDALYTVSFAAMRLPSWLVAVFLTVFMATVLVPVALRSAVLAGTPAAPRSLGSRRAIVRPMAMALRSGPVLAMGCGSGRCQGGPLLARGAAVFLRKRDPDQLFNVADVSVVLAGAQ